VVAVEDDGPGVAPDQVPLVFARRVSSSGGTGIGLALARDLVQGAGGRLVLARPRPPRFELLLPSA
jgi:signal transduction histidine kinase